MEYEDKNIACSEDHAGRLILYFNDLSNHEYEKFPSEEKEFVLETHQHLQNCLICSNGFNYIKSMFATIEGGSEVFSSKHFKLLKNNERYLDDLVRKKE